MKSSCPSLPSPSSVSNSPFSWFWSESIWVHPGYTWYDIETRAGVSLSDLYWSALTAVVIIIVRFAVEGFVLKPIGIRAGLKDRSSASYKKKKSPDAIYSHPRLDVIWKSKKNEMLTFKKQVLDSVIKELNDNHLNQRQLERWIRRKANSERSSRLERFTEALWRMLFYAFAFCFGIFALWDKDWFNDSTYCFKDYPCHPVGDKEWYYYNIELGFYLSLIISQFTDVPKKDFWQMFIHHVVTVMLLTFSWTCNFVRIGTLVMVIHDFADIPLEGAKLCRYLRVSDTVSNTVFAVFTSSWIFSRLGLFPYRVILQTSWFALNYVTFFPVYWIFNALLVSLQVLHVIWTFLILRIAYNAIYDDGVKDLREDSSLSSSPSSVEDNNEAEDTGLKTNGVMNGSLGGGDVRKRQTIITGEGETNNHRMEVTSNGKANGKTH